MPVVERAELLREARIGLPVAFLVAVEIADGADHLVHASALRSGQLGQIEVEAVQVVCVVVEVGPEEHHGSAGIGVVEEHAGVVGQQRICHDVQVVDINPLRGIAHKALEGAEVEFVGDVVVRPEQDAPFVGEFALQGVEVQHGVFHHIAQARLEAVIAPGGRIQQELLFRIQAQAGADFAAQRGHGFGVMRFADDAVVAGVALLQHHVGAPFLGQAEGVRQMQRGIGRRGHQIAPLPGVQLEAPRQFLGGVQRAVQPGYVEAQALERGAVPALHVGLIVFGEEVFRHAGVHDPGAAFRACLPVFPGSAYHGVSAVHLGEMLQRFGRFGVVGPDEAVAVEARVGAHGLVDGAGRAGVLAASEALEEHHLGVGGGACRKLAVCALLLAVIGFTGEHAQHGEMAKRSQRRLLHVEVHG